MNENYGQCMFNKMIDCRENICNFCGWNPDVQEARVREFLRQRQEVHMTEQDEPKAVKG